MKEKHLVCQGAICKCQFGTTPDKLVVKTQSKRYINDKEGLSKLTATNVDIGSTFDKNTFGSCAKMNNNPCAPVVTKWEGYYDKITVVDNGGKALLEDSKATCAVSGTPSIEIVFHGQTAEPNLQNVNNARPEVLAHLMPFVEEKLNGYYYNYNGIYEGNITNQKKGNANDVYACNGKGNEEGDFLNAKKLDITHEDFCLVAGIIKLESGSNDYNELKCISNTASNRAKHKKITLRILLEKGEPIGNSKYIPYSTVPKKDKKQLDDSNITSYDSNTRKALIDVLNGGSDNSYSAELWDGDDFLVWGAGEINPYGKISHAKFREYAFIKIPKDIYEKYKKEIIDKYGANISYGDGGTHIKLAENNQEHTHYSTPKGTKKIKYSIPQSVFSNKENWGNGYFYYDTKQNKSEGLVATTTYGRTIFWKLQKK
ncbi:DUF4280 domain-containing protein [Chryseobacterium sp. ERMR1:04]|uniref:DUF4280 domain-containing protein n=1 Tax=Chryseobacterium sp. ERMR1:04 TaxID=1705393 RepID=UPI0009E66E59|nr:DUF4280 domain-containing protein [Chryseobacterium sp. ERMR1:04]